MLDLQQILLQGFCHGAAAAVHLSLGRHVPHVHVDCMETEEELVGNLFLGVSIDQQLETRVPRGVKP